MPLNNLFVNKNTGKAQPAAVDDKGNLIANVTSIALADDETITFGTDNDASISFVSSTNRLTFTNTPDGFRFAAGTLTTGAATDTGLYLTQTLNDSAASGGTYRARFTDITATNTTGWGNNVFLDSLKIDGYEVWRIQRYTSTVHFAVINTALNGADGLIIQEANTNVAGLTHSGSFDQLVINSSVYSGRQLIFGEQLGSSVDYGHATQPNLTTYWHSVNSPATNPTEWGSATFDQTNFVITAGKGMVVSGTTTAGITASTTQSQGQGALTTNVNEVATVANANDTVTLPAAVANARVVVINNGANTLQIFPASGDNLGAGVDTSTTLASGSNVVFVAYNSTNWEVI